MKADCRTCRYPCPNGTMGAAGFCTSTWNREVETLSENMPKSIRECIANLPVEQRKEIFTLEDWQAIHYWEVEYGYAVDAALGDKSKVLPKERQKFEACMKSIVAKVVARYQSKIEGVEPAVKKPSATQSAIWTRFGKDF